MVIITSLDEEDNKETVPNTKEPERTTPLDETYWQWQQPPSHHQWGPSPPPPNWGQPYSSWTSATAAGHYWQSDQASRHRWYDQSSYMSQDFEYYRSHHGQGTSWPIFDQQWHYSHPSGGSVPYGSYSAFAEEDPYNAFYEPQRQQAYNFCQRPQQGVHSASFASSRDTMFENYEWQQQPAYDFYQGPQQDVNPTHFASARDATFGNDKEYLRFGVGNMNMAGSSRLNTTTANTPTAGPSQSRPTTSHMPGSSRTKPTTSKMPMPNIPGVSSTPRQTTRPSPAGNKESLDELLTRELKHIVKQAISSLMSKSNQVGAGVLNPTPITIVLPEEDHDNYPLSPEVGELALQVVEEEETKTQKKQRVKAELVGIEHSSFSDDLPAPVMQSVNDFVSKWKGTYKYTLLERLNGWRLERKQRINSRYDWYYYHDTSGGFFRSVIEITRFVLRDERPSKR